MKRPARTESMFAYADMPWAYYVSLHRDGSIDYFEKAGILGSVIHQDRQRDRPDDAGATSRYASIEQGANSCGELVHRKMDRKRRTCVAPPSAIFFHANCDPVEVDGWFLRSNIHESE